MIILLVLTIASAGCLDFGGDDKKDDKGGGDGEGPLAYALNLTYLDHTEGPQKTWEVKVSGSVDYGVLLLRNEGAENDSARLEVVTVTDGWDVSLSRGSVDLPVAAVEPVMVTYSPGEGEGEAILRASSEGDEEVSDEMILKLGLGSASADITAIGDQVMVEYYLEDENGTYLDDGTLPATAGEPEAGPAGTVSYITGFYLGLLGMEKGGGVVIQLGGETKTIRVPPELGYGTDPDKHELGGVWLHFTLTIVASSRTSHI